MSKITDLIRQSSVLQAMDWEEVKRFLALFPAERRGSVVNWFLGYARNGVTDPTLVVHHVRAELWNRLHSCRYPEQRRKTESDLLNFVNYPREADVCAAWYVAYAKAESTVTLEPLPRFAIAKPSVSGPAIAKPSVPSVPLPSRGFDSPINHFQAIETSYGGLSLIHI